MLLSVVAGGGEMHTWYDPVCWIFMNKKLESREGAGLGSAYPARIRQSRILSKTCVPFAACHTRTAVQLPQGLHHPRSLRLAWAITTQSEWIRIRKANWFVVAVVGYDHKGIYKTDNEGLGSGFSREHWYIVAALRHGNSARQEEEN
jgi:hypothetical protein